MFEVSGHYELYTVNRSGGDMQSVTRFSSGNGETFDQQIGKSFCFVRLIWERNATNDFESLGSGLWITVRAFVKRKLGRKNPVSVRCISPPIASQLLTVSDSRLWMESSGDVSDDGRFNVYGVHRPSIANEFTVVEADLPLAISVGERMA